MPHADSVLWGVSLFCDLICSFVIICLYSCFCFLFAICHVLSCLLGVHVFFSFVFLRPPALRSKTDSHARNACHVALNWSCRRVFEAPFLVANTLNRGDVASFRPQNLKSKGCKMYCTVLGGHHSSRNDGGFLEVIFDSSHLDQTQDS